MRKVLDYRDKVFSPDYFYQNLQDKDSEIEALKNSLFSRDLAYTDLDSKKQSLKAQNLEEALLESENDIKDLLKDYEKLQQEYKNLESQKLEIEKENLQLREKLALKSNQLVNIYQNQDFQIPEEYNNLKNQYLELINSNQYLQSQLAIIRSKGNEYADSLYSYKNSIIDKEILIQKIEESFNSKLLAEIECLDSQMIEELRKKLYDYEKKNFEICINNDVIRIELNAVKNLLDEEKKSEKEAKGNKNDWKKFKREHVSRIEKVYSDQINELKSVLTRLSANYKEKEKQFVDFSKKYEKEIKDLAAALKKEHESKKMIAECFVKEKDNYEKIKETSTNIKNYEEVLNKKYNEAKFALEESNKKIFKLEQELNKKIEILTTFESNEKIYKDKIEDLESIRAKLCAEITRLNKQIQDFEMEKTKFAIEKRSNQYFTQEHKENLSKELCLSEQKLEQLQKENFQLKNEIFEADFKLKNSENELEKLQILKKTIQEMQKNASTQESLNREKVYLESENKSLREDIKNYQGTIQQLKQELKSLSSELFEAHKDFSLIESKKSLEISKEFNKATQLQYQEELENIQNRLANISKEFNMIKEELDKTTEEKNSLIKGKKLLETEISTLKSKNSSFSKEIPSEFLTIKEKVQELEMKYESLEASQDEMILKIRKIHKE